MSHTHDLSYLLKTDLEGHYSGRVVELPAVITQGMSETEIDTKIQKATLDYLQTFAEEHTRIMQCKPEPRLVDSGKGIVVKTKQFKVQC